MLEKPLAVLDIFSGIGGFSLGLEKAGMQTVAFCEINPFCQQILKKHWASTPVFTDVTKLKKEDFATLPVIDVIAGGFPCQDISCAGKQVGISGKRSNLWKEFKRLINEIKPKYAIIENVANLRNNGLVTVLQDLWEIGYDAEWHCIPASSFSAPHRRDRVWIIAHSFRAAARQKNATNTDCNRRDGRECNRQRGYLQRDSEWEYQKIHQERKVGKSGVSKVCEILPDTDECKSGIHRGVEDSKICRQEMLSYYRELGSKQWEKEPETAARLKDERLNPKWVEWLMGFPSEWTKSGNSKQRLSALGNSVVPLIPEFLGKSIINHSNKDRTISILERVDKTMKKN